jgi:phage-related protein (TIGR01555 family)
MAKKHDRPYSDDWLNTITKLGTTSDKSRSTSFGGGALLDHTTLENLYQENSLAARIVDRLPDDATREPFQIVKPDEEFDEDALRSWLEDYEALQVFGDAWKWGRLFGGSLIVMAVNDGRPFEMPIDLDHVRGLAGLSVIDSRWIQPDIFDAGLGSRGFGDPRHYHIYVPYGRQGDRKIHRSRVIRFDAFRVPPYTMIKNNGWAPSVLERVHNSLRRLGTVRGYAEHILHHASLMTLKLTNMRNELKGGEKSRKGVEDALTAIKEAMDVLHILGIDAADDLGRNETGILSGLKDILERFLDDLVADTDQPRSLLLGETPGGLNTGENAGETRAWYDHVNAKQRTELTPKINQLLEVIFAIMRNRGQATPTKWTIDYASLWQMSEADEAAIRLQNAQADTAYWTMGSIGAEEIRAARFVEGNQGAIAIEGEDLETPPELPEEEEPELEVPEGEEGEQSEEDETPRRPLPDEPLLSARAIAERLGIAPSTVIAMFNRQEILGWKVGGRYKFALSEVMESLEDGRTA